MPFSGGRVDSGKREASVCCLSVRTSRLSRTFIRDTPRAASATNAASVCFSPTVRGPTQCYVIFNMLLSSVTVTAISFHDISEIMWRLCPWCQLTERACVTHATTQAALAETPPQIILVRAILSRSVYSSNPVKQNAPTRRDTTQATNGEQRACM